MKAALLLLVHLAAAAAIAARGGPHPFFGYDPTPAPSDDTYSSYTSIASFARAYQPPRFARAHKIGKNIEQSTTGVRFSQSTSADEASQPILSKKFSQPVTSRRLKQATPLTSFKQSPLSVRKSAAVQHFTLPTSRSAAPLPLRSAPSSAPSEPIPVRPYQRALFYKPVVTSTYEAPTDYNFDWSVKNDYSGNDFDHQETRDGDHTRGSYSVLLPDGRLQTVTYYVDGDSGYVAEVSYQDAKKMKYTSSASHSSASKGGLAHVYG